MCIRDRSVTLQVDGTNVSKAIYEYYGASDTYGNLNDLMRVTQQQWSSGVFVDVGLTYYRYYKPGERHGFPHALRAVSYTHLEAIHCIHQKNDTPAVIRAQIYRYTQEGYPANNGLMECSILLRRNTKKIRQFNELWWSEIQTGSIRDQISFPYVARKIGIKINYFPGAVGDGTWFIRRKHLQHPV